MPDEELRIPHSQHPQDESESGSFLNFKIKLKPMDNNQEADQSELTDRSNLIKTDRDYLPTVTGSSSPELGRVSPDKVQVYSANSSSIMWKDDPPQKESPVVPKIFVTRNSQEALTSSKELMDQ